MIGIKPLFSGRSLGEGETASFDVVLAAPDGKTLAAKGLRYELLKVEQRYQWYRRDGRWEYEPIKLDPARMPTAASMLLPTSPGALRCRCNGAAIGWRFRPAIRMAR